LSATPAANQTGATLVSGNGEDGVISTDVYAGVTYTLSEQGPAGYLGGEWQCDITITEGTITLTSGQNVKCTINNDDIAPKLTLNKIVINDNGGTAPASDWTLTATGPTTISGLGDDNSSIDVVGIDRVRGNRRL
jgi:large repetitive protein